VKGVDHETTIDKIRYNQHVHERKNTQAKNIITLLLSISWNAFALDIPESQDEDDAPHFNYVLPNFVHNEIQRASKFSTSENNEENDL
jgi:hypothetical protein